jgi:hypothetical protein
MSGFSMEIRGVEMLVAKLASIPPELLSNVGVVLQNFGERVLEDSKENYCPIEDPPLDNIVLRDTGTVSDVDVSPSGLSVRLSYNTPYAVTVHEHVSPADPPTWRGKVINFRVGGPKYLERPVAEHSHELAGDVARAVAFVTRKKFW